jgi:Zn-dependent alcohol dehydrogenase
MRAAVCREFGAPLSIEEVMLGEPQSGEVRVAVKACGLCQSDLHYLAGAWGGKLPAIYGHEVAGIVDAVGSGVKGLGPGDRVVVSMVRWCGRCFFCVKGQPALCEAIFRLDEATPIHDMAGQPIVQGTRAAGFAESVLVHASQAVSISDDIPFESACLIGCAVMTGFGAVLNTAKVQAGDSVVVIGTGGVGLNAVQAALLAGASPLIALDINAHKLKVAAAFGASDCIESDSAAEDEVRRRTSGRGADSVIVTAGAGLAVEQALRMARRGGTVVVVGMPGSGATSRLDPAQFSHDGQRIIGSKLGSGQPAVDVRRFLSLYRERRIKLDELVSHCFGLDQINDAIDSAGRGEVIRSVMVFRG